MFLKTTFIRRKNKINHKYFEQLNNYLLNYIYINNDRKIIAVDGTYISLLRSLSNEGLKISTRDNYCVALISTLFDVEKEIPINYSLFKNNNERDAL